jgi:serine/threonine-protein kinase
MQPAIGEPLHPSTCACNACSAVDATVPGTVFEDRYRVDEYLSRGGMAIVYRGTDLTLDRPVAIKLLDPRFHCDRDLVARFLREARGAASLEHPNIVPIYSVGVGEGHHYMVMKLIDGDTADRFVDREGGERIADALRIGIQVCLGLAHIHARGYVHRDVKPSNIMVDGAGHAYLLDFGILRNIHEHQTQVVQITGTPAYMSPEQARDARTADARSDLYSLGSMLFELIAGRPPFDAASAIAILVQHLSNPVPRLSDLIPEIPPELDTLLARAMAKEPQLRFASAEEMASAIEEVICRVSGGPDHRPPIMVPMRATPAVRRGDTTVAYRSVPPAAKGATARRWVRRLLVATGASVAVAGASLAVVGRDVPPVHAAACASPIAPPRTEVTARPKPPAKAAAAPVPAARPPAPKPRKRPVARRKREVVRRVRKDRMPIHPSAPRVAATARLRVSIQEHGRPSFAELVLNGTSLGSTGEKARVLPPGNYRILIRRPGFVTQQQLVDLDRGTEQLVVFNMFRN